MKTSVLTNIIIIAVIIILLYVLYKIQETFEVTPTPSVMPTTMPSVTPMPTYASITLPESAVPYKSLLTSGAQGTLNVFNPVVRKL